MLRMALSQHGRVALPASSLADFRKSLDENRPRLVIAAADDVAAAGLDPVLLERLVGESTSVILLSSARPLPEPPGPRTRVLPIPFTARDLLEALGSSAGHIPTQPTSLNSPFPANSSPAYVPADTANIPASVPSTEAMTEIIRREVERLVSDTARQAIEVAVLRLVPELAEAIIRAELARILNDSDETALAGAPSSEDDR
jgi:hypothetical protein